MICPKCQQKYEDAAQRFCVNDGARLHPSINSENSAEPAGVFSGILKKNADFLEKTEIKPAPPKLINKQFVKKNELKDKSKKIKKPAPPGTFTKLIRPDEILSGQAQLGDRRVNPVGRFALSAENPNILLGQTIKGRYFIKSRLSQTARSIKYLATDNLNSDKKVIVRIYTAKLDESDFSARVFAEERVALSHINHPNIAKVIDSGELPEGNPFIVSDHVKGSSLKESFLRGLFFDRKKTARIIRQAADALSEAHQNGVLHRNLNPENIIISPTVAGSELVKVTDFNIFSEITRGDFNYFAPERIAAKPANFSGDIYSLAVIAYQLLTGKTPFQVLTSKDLYKAQKNVIQIFDEAANLPPQTKAVLQKALAFDPTERFQKVRDFGDALYNSLIPENENLNEPDNLPDQYSTPETDEFTVSLDSVLDEFSNGLSAGNQILKTHESPVEMSGEVSTVKFQTDKNADPAGVEIEKPTGSIKFHNVGIGKNEFSAAPDKKTEAPWERRSIEPPVEGGQNWTFVAILGIGVLFFLSAAIFYYFVNRPADTEFVKTQTQNQIPENAEKQTGVDNNQDINEIPPPPRKIVQPENTKFFENSKENLSKELLKYYRNFTLYYPETWKRNKFDKERNKVDDKFIDISKNGADGIPLEMFMVSYYESNGTFELDKDMFPEIVNKASEDIKSSPLPNFELIGQGMVNLNKTEDYEGWKAYEMKFQGEGTALNGDKIKLWGRHFYIPPARPNVKNGLVVTLLATSLSKDVKSADDLGIKGDLKTILYTFEPDQNF